MDQRPASLAFSEDKTVILIVDDEPLVRSVLEVALRKAGLQVLSAGSSDEAIHLYGENRHAIGQVLLDVRMPEKDGPQTLAALRRIDPELVCWFMSGDTGAYSWEELHEMGAAGVFAKPFQLAEVVAAVRKLTPAVPAPGDNRGIPNAPPEGGERRQSPRRTSRPVEVFLTDAHGSATPARAYVVNCSQGGLCLSTANAAEDGALLNIRPTNVPESEPWAQVRVQYHMPHNDGWELGCQFVKDLPWDVRLFG